MKKVLQLSAIALGVLVASTAFAAGGYKGEGATYKGEMPAPCPVEKGLMGGFYLGGQVGYDMYRVKASLNSFGTTNSPNFNAQGFVGGLFAGYGQYFNTGYLGAEVFGNYSNANESYSLGDPSLAYTSKFNASGAYGVAFLPGLKLNNSTLGYVRLGYGRSRVKGQDTISQTGVGSDSTSKSSWVSGFQYGLGLETLLVDNWSVRTEYSRTDYGSISNTASSYKPSNNQFMVGLLYHFA